MSLPATSFRINPDWFTIKGNMGVLKREHRADFEAALKESRQAAKAEFEKEQEKGAVELTEEQKKELASKYDPEDMTQEEYDAFIDDLCNYGVLTKTDKYYVDAKTNPGGIELVPLEHVKTGAWIVSVPNGDFGSCFESLSQAKGNVLSWARFQSSYKEIDELTGLFTKTRSAILFGKIENVLMQMNSVRKAS